MYVPAGFLLILHLLADVELVHVKEPGVLVHLNPFLQYVDFAHSLISTHGPLEISPFE
jgi:hypothetical protein